MDTRQLGSQPLVLASKLRSQFNQERSFRLDLFMLFEQCLITGFVAQGVTLLSPAERDRAGVSRLRT